MTKPSRLKIAFVHPDLGIGGAERLVLDVAGALTTMGHRVSFVTNHFDPSHCFDELKRGDYPVEVYGDWIPRSLCGKFQALCAYVRMAYLIIVYLTFGRSRDDKPDLYFTDLIPVANPFLKLAGEKVLYYCHHPDLLASSPGGALKRLYRAPLDWLEMKATARSDVILVNSEYTASIFKQTFPQITRPLRILYPTVASSYQRTVDGMRSPKPIEDVVPGIEPDGEKIVFLSLNRFHPAKRLELAIEAMDALRTVSTPAQWNKTYLVIAGGYDPNSPVNSETFSTLTNLTARKNLQDKIIFIKSPDDRLKADLLASCTCLVYTPIKEHFGIVPLEAMTVSKPVIAVDSGGPRETVLHGETGYLCEPTPDSMAGFMHGIIRDGVGEMGARGRRRLEERFSYERFRGNLRRIVGGVDGGDEKRR